MRTAYAAAFLGLLVPVSLAQVPPAAGASSVELLLWTGGLGLGSFTDGLVCDLDDDGLADAVIQRADKLVFAHSADVFTNLTLVADAVNAMASFGGTEHVPEGLAAVRAGGLYAYELDTSAGQISFTSTLLAAGDWAGAVDLYRADWDGVDGPDLVGLSADRTKVLVLPRSGSGWGTTITVQLPHVMKTFAPLQWDTTAGALEIVLVEQTTEKVYVYPATGGSPLYSRGNALGRSLIAVLPNSGDDANDLSDRVAFYMGNATGSVGFLTVFDRVGTETAVSFAGEKPYALSACDALGDDEADLSITFESAADVMLSVNLSSQGTPTFDPTNPTSTFYLELFDGLGLQPVDPANHAAACFGDLDADGKTDLLLPSDAAGGVVLAHAGFGPEAGTGTRGVTPLSSSACQVDGFARLSFELRYEDFDEQEVDRFDVSVFYQEDETQAVDPDAISTCPVPDETGVTAYTVEIDLDGFGAAWDETDEHVYFLVIRPVDSSGRIVDSPVIAVFTLNDAGLVALPRSEGWEGGPDEFSELLECDQGNPPTGSPLVGFMGITRVAEYPGGEVPVYGGGCAVAGS